MPFSLRKDKQSFHAQADCLQSLHSEPNVDSNSTLAVIYTAIELVTSQIDEELAKAATFSGRFLI